MTERLGPTFEWRSGKRINEMGRRTNSQRRAFWRAAWPRPESGEFPFWAILCWTAIILFVGGAGLAFWLYYKLSEQLPPNPDSAVAFRMGWTFVGLAAGVFLIRRIVCRLLD